MTAMRRLRLTPGLLVAAAAGSLAAPAAAQSLADYDYENLAFRGVGVDVGYIWADKVEDTELYSARLDLGYLGPGVRIIPSLSYWSSQFTRGELEDLALRLSQASGTFVEVDSLAPLKWSAISLSLDGHFVWNTPVHILTYVGGGVGLHALNGQGAAIDDTFVEDLLDAIYAGVSALAGFEFEPLNRLRVYGEGRYTALNSIQYTSVRAGLQFMFMQGETDQVGAAMPAPGLGEEAR